MAVNQVEEVPGFKQVSLNQLLTELNRQGGFSASVVATGDGLPIASLAPGLDTDTVAAMVAFVRGVVERARGQMGFARVDEVSVVDDDRIRLVCRYFVIADEALILAVVLPANQRYRKLTNQAVKAIKQIWTPQPLPGRA